MGLDRDDFAAGDADIQRLFARPISEAGIANDQIHAIVSLPYNSSSYAPHPSDHSGPAPQEIPLFSLFLQEIISDGRSATAETLDSRRGRQRQNSGGTASRRRPSD
jgi:hypothetical protein